jgi:hypothetical protein
MDHESLFWAYFAVERQGGYGANPSSHQRCEAVGCRKEHVEELKGEAAYLSHTGNGQACRVNSLPRRASIEEEHFESTTPNRPSSAAPTDGNILHRLGCSAEQVSRFVHTLTTLPQGSRDIARRPLELFLCYRVARALLEGLDAPPAEAQISNDHRLVPALATLHDHRSSGGFLKELVNHRDDI